MLPYNMTELMYALGMMSHKSVTIDLFAISVPAWMVFLQTVQNARSPTQEFDTDYADTFAVSL